MRHRFIRLSAFIILVAALSAIMTLGVVLVIGDRKADTNSYHTQWSIEMAYNWTHCGRFSELKEIGGVGDRFQNPPNPHYTPLNELVTVGTGYGSVEKYCSGSFSSARNGDSSLTYLFAAVMAVFPNVSANRLFLSLTFVMMACFVVFGLAVARAFRSALVLGAALLFGIALYAVVSIDQYLSTRVFMWPPLLMIVGLLALTFRARLYERMVPHALIMLTAGFLGAFVFNMRASLVLHVIMMLFVYAVFVVMARGGVERQKRWRARAAAVATILVGVALGIWLHHFALISPMASIQSRDLTHHSFAHPVVIGLAKPPNGLAEREGIRWEDRVGDKIAQREDPGALQSWERVESALWQYYVGLWRAHPWEMLKLYARKGHEAGKGEVQYLKSVVVGWLSPFSVILSGYYIAGAMVLTGVISSVAARDRWSPKQLLVWTLIALALAEYFESAVVFPQFSLYFPVLIYVLVFLSAFVWSVLEFKFLPKPLAAWRERVMNAVS